MPHKALFVFALIFITQFICSCDWCNCTQGKDREIIYEDVEIRAWNTAGFQSELVKDSVFKKAFGLSVSVDFTTTEISMLKDETKGSFGFQNAMACDCFEGNRYYNDPMTNLKIFVKDSVSDKGRDVTSNFSAYGYHSDRVSIEELFASRADWHDGFQFDLTKTDSIPNSAVFTVEVSLKSGKILSSETERIQFYE